MNCATNILRPNWLIRNKLATAVLSSILSFSTALYADDTEVFFGQSNAQANVLFVVDVSGSMSELDGGTTTRLERLQTALTDLLATTNDINVGLLTFTGNGNILDQEIAPITDNRAAMQASIDALGHVGGTPTLQALYQAGQYFRGQELDAINQTYASPMQSACQSNHIVLLSDGSPTEMQWVVDVVEADLFAPPAATAAPIVMLDLDGEGPLPATVTNTCVDTDVDGGTNNGTCGVELAAWLATTDQSATIPDTNTVTTHTIGFNFSAPWLADISAAARGQNFTAETSGDLIDAFDTILSVATDSTNTFAAPAITLDQFTRFSNRDDMYLGLFQPGNSQRWTGNLKRYKFDGKIRDENGLVAIDAAGAFDPNASSWWSTDTDGGDVASGGAANKLGTGTRKVYTHLGSDEKNLTHSSKENWLHKDNGLVTAAMLGVPDAERDNLLDWANGVDVDDVDEDPSTTTRLEMGDPLHSRPAILTYGGSEAQPNSVVFIGTNEGYLHAIDSHTGQEVFAFVPEALIGNLDVNYQNERTINRLYGIDGDLTLWVDDANNDGIISGSNEHAYLYAGMRRGGDTYFALDVTIKDQPKFLWSKSSADTGFEKLGQSWSKPTLSKVILDNVVTDVLIFGGGYNPIQDLATFRSTDTVGNDMFIINARNGDLIWNTSIASDPTPYDDDMNYSIPSDPQVVDFNGDGVVDQIYIGDMGGQVWRFDINGQAGADGSDLVSGGVIASLSGTEPADNRRFFYPPDVAIVKDGNSRFLSVAIGSGNRSHPLDRTINDRFYMIRQETYLTAPEGYGIEVASTDPNSTAVEYTALTETNLYNATENLIGSNTVSIADGAADALADAEGWLLELDSGEKVLAQALTVNNQVVFTTYVPQVADINNCSPAVGIGRAYTVSVLNATPPAGSSPADRIDELQAPGIPSKPIPFIDVYGDLTNIAGTEVLDTPTYKEMERVYWSEQPEY